MKRLTVLAGIIGLALFSGLAAQQPTALYKGIEENLPLQVKSQPIPFSHRQHIEAGSECKDCHPKASTADYAGLPAANTCMICHQAVKTDSPHIQRLKEMAANNGKVNWVRVYRVPDFVFFSHKNHLAAGEKCETCHGPVATRDVLAKEVSTSMTSCMNCHQQREVSTDCHLCHTLGF